MATDYRELLKQRPHRGGRYVCDPDTGALTCVEQPTQLPVERIEAPPDAASMDREEEGS